MLLFTDIEIAQNPLKFIFTKIKTTTRNAPYSSLWGTGHYVQLNRCMAPRESNDLSVHETQAVVELLVHDVAAFEVTVQVALIDLQSCQPILN